MFKFELSQTAKIAVSGEVGIIRGRAEYVGCENGYLIHYKANDGRAQQQWFDESTIVAGGSDGLITEMGDQNLSSD